MLEAWTVSPGPGQDVGGRSTTALARSSFVGSRARWTVPQATCALNPFIVFPPSIWTTAAPRPIGLGDDPHNHVRRREQTVERGDGKLRRAEKHDAKRTPGYHLPARVSFLILRTIRSRLMPRRRSTNSVPSR